MPLLKRSGIFNIGPNSPNGFLRESIGGEGGRVMRRNEERSEEYRLKGAVLGPKKTAAKNAHRMSGLGICSRAAKGGRPKPEGLQGRADLRAAQ